MRGHRSRLALVVLVLALASQGVVRADATEEECAVYRALLQQVEWSLPKKEGSTIDRYVVREATKAYRPEEPLALGDRYKKSLPGLEPSTVAAYEGRSRTQERLDPRCFTGMPVHLMSERESRALLWSSHEGPWTFDGQTFRRSQTDGWQYFDMKYRRSQGLLTVSRVAFSEDGRQALLNYENEMPDSTGEGCLVLFEKTLEGWTMRKHLGLWSSIS